MADKHVADNIRQFRMARGLKQHELASMIGKKGSTVSNWERGLRDPGADNIRKIAAALNIPASELLGHNPDVVRDNTFDVICKDMAMLPEIRPGDRIHAKKGRKIKTGDYVVADLPGGKDPVIRQYVIIEGKPFLMPLNRTAKFSPIETFTITGKCLELNRKL